jgi:hypothetical protein
MDGDQKRGGAQEAIEAIRLRLEAGDPEVLRAAAEVDRTLVRSLREKPPLERLRGGIAFSHGLARFRRVGDARG